MRINGSASWNNKHENFSAKKSGIFYITPPILVLEAKFEYSCNSYEISDQMSYTEAHQKKSRTCAQISKQILKINIGKTHFVKN